MIEDSRYRTVSIPSALSARIDVLMDELGYWLSYDVFVREACLEKISGEERRLRELRGYGSEANQPERGVRPR